MTQTGDDGKGTCGMHSRSTASASMQGTRHIHATATVSPAMGGGQGTGEKRARAPDMTDTLQPAIPFEAGAPAACAGDWGGGGGSGGGRRHVAYSHGHMPYSHHMPYSLATAPPLHPLTPLNPVDSGAGGVEPPALPRDKPLPLPLPSDLPLHSQRQLLLVSPPPSLSSFPLPLLSLFLSLSFFPLPPSSLTPGAWLACWETKALTRGADGKHRRRGGERPCSVYLPLPSRPIYSPSFNLPATPVCQGARACARACVARAFAPLRACTSEQARVLWGFVCAHVLGARKLSLSRPHRCRHKQTAYAHLHKQCSERERRIRKGWGGSSLRT
jgi:hypothetical protein